MDPYWIRHDMRFQVAGILAPVTVEFLRDLFKYGYREGGFWNGYRRMAQDESFLTLAEKLDVHPDMGMPGYELRDETYRRVFDTMRQIILGQPEVDWVYAGLMRHCGSEWTYPFWKAMVRGMSFEEYVQKPSWERLWITIPPDQVPRDIRDRSVEQIGLPIPLVNMLTRSQCKSVGDFLDIGGPSEALRLRNMGEITLMQIVRTIDGLIWGAPWDIPDPQS